MVRNLPPSVAALSSGTTGGGGGNGTSGAITTASSSLNNLPTVLDNGRIVAWGNNSSGQCDVLPSLNDAVAIAGGGYHSLAIKANGTIAAWGASLIA